MLSPRLDAILKYIVAQYIANATPVSSQSVARDAGLSVSSATVRNEMAYLETQGYILRLHTSAGSIPSDKGYRYYVDSLQKLDLSLERRRQLSHLFHQVEEQVDQWLSLAATILAQLNQNVGVVAVPRQSDCQYKHIELVSLQERMALMVLILVGARVKQKLVSFDCAVSQADLTIAAGRLNDWYAGLTASHISDRKEPLIGLVSQVRDTLLSVMRAEDEQGYREPYLDGLHLILSQPEFARGEHALDLITLVETHNLLKSIVPSNFKSQAVHVIIGDENKAAAIKSCSVVISQYGIPEATGTIGVVGPTRMAYSNAIPSVLYLSTILTEMVAGLYGKEKPRRGNAG